MEITVFAFRGQNVRTVSLDGEPWFVAKDVCDVLGLENVTRALDGLDEDEKITLTNSKGNPRAGNPLTFNAVSESGVTGKGQIYFVNKFLQVQQVA